MMEQTTLPYTDLTVSKQCLGLASLGHKNSEAEAFELMDCFVEQGGNFLDTARIYSNWIPGERHRSERILSDWLSSRNNREQLVIATKGGHRNEIDKSNRVTPEEVSKDLAGSLAQLRIDHIDLYYLHRDDPSVSVAVIIDYLNEEIAAGKIRYIGCSNWSAARLAEANAYAQKNGKQGFVASQPRWSLGSRHMKTPADPTLLRLRSEGYEYHKSHQITLIPYSSQAGGFFSKFAITGDSESLEKLPLYSKENLAIAEKLKALSDRCGIDIAHLVLAFLFERPFPVIPLVGCRIASQMEDSVKSLDIEIPTDVMAELKALDPWD